MRRRLLRVLLVLGLLGALAGAGLTWYLNAIFLPGPARQWIGTQLAQATGRRVQVGPLTFRLWEGISIDQVVIFEAAPHADQPCLEVERITFTCLYLPLFRERRVIIPALRVSRPRLRLARGPQGTWNTQSLWWLKPRQPSSARFPLTVVAPKLVIVNGELLMEDARSDPGLDATLTRINLRAALHLPRTLSVKGTAQWQTKPSTPLLLHATWDLRDRAGRGTLTARQLALDTIRPYLPSAAARVLTDVTGSATITLKGTYQGKQADVTATVAT